MERLHNTARKHEKFILSILSAQENHSLLSLISHGEKEAARGLPRVKEERGQGWICSTVRPAAAPTPDIRILAACATTRRGYGSAHPARKLPYSVSK